MPAVFNSEDDSNNQKILKINANLLNYCKNNLILDHNLSKLENATGQYLTDLASDYGITRIDSDDEFLKFQISWQRLKSNTPSTMNGLKTLISRLLNINLQDFDILPTENPKEIQIVNIPFDFNSGSHSEIKREILSSSIKSIIPKEYKLKDIQYQKQSYGNLYIGVIGIKHIFKESEVVSFGNL